ncbi:MAG: VCBS repeat-containing protein [Bacteroidota bacterium]
MRYINLYFLGLLLLVLMACESGTPKVGKTLFTAIPTSYSGIDLQNELSYNQQFNIYTYRNFYNGGGVAIGDLNQDGLADIYMTANMKPNKLYLNKGDFKFEDISKQTGIEGSRAWSTGVSMADVNGDGLLDIYVCNSGDIEGDNKQNELYINKGPDANGIPQFEEEAETYGLADQGLSTHAAFFDYDKDGDLDVYLLNNSYRAIGSFNKRVNERPIRDSVGGDKLYRNEGGKFVDVSEEANIFGSVIGFGLGVTIGDVNQDGWQDIFVSNDFFERDYLYINNQDGTFSEQLKEKISSISNASMGADMADINNDAFPDIFVTDMLPESDARLKQVSMFENWNKYQLNLNYDFYHQFTRNMLQLNTGEGDFREVGRLTDVEATDWSWGALIWDMDNDGLKDLFVANGIYQDLTDLDFINFLADRETMRQYISKEKGIDYKSLIDSIPTRPIPNYAFHNQGNYDGPAHIPRFINKANDWGLGAPNHSNGSAYGDLDNDGDLDLVVSSVNSPVQLYRSEVDTLTDNHYISLEFKGEGKNAFALGTQVHIKAGDLNIYQEHMPMRGFQSSMDYRMVIGLGQENEIKLLEVNWPDGKQTRMENVSVDQLMLLEQAQANGSWEPGAETKESKALFAEVDRPNGLDFKHEENTHNDFNQYRLIYHMNSAQGPKLTQGDVNGDGLADLYIGGAKDQAGQLLIQRPGKRWAVTNQELMEADKRSEDTDAIFFDADGDGDLDLYVASGGTEFGQSNSALKDRIYLNDGRGRFTKSRNPFRGYIYESTACVQAADIDKDGDQDLFVGVRLKPKFYGTPVDGIILENDGKGIFTNKTREIAPELSKIGMITDAYWADLDQDADPDLLLVGEWMAIEAFENQEGKLIRKTADAGLQNSQGWWSCLKPGDFDGDGDLDFVVGNHGMNTRFQASEDKPLKLYVNDFDRNGAVEQIVAYFEGDQLMPFVRLPELSMQMPLIKKKYLRFSSFMGQDMATVFGEEKLDQSVVSEARELRSSILVNEGNFQFSLQPLPVEAQLAPAFGLYVEDVDADGKEDILMGGNFFWAKPEVGRYDAMEGLLLKGNGNGTFEPMLASETGFEVEGEVRDMTAVKVGNESWIVVARNNESLQVFRKK